MFFTWQGPLGEQKLLFDVMASGGATAVPDLMLTSSVEGSLDDDYLVRNQEPVFGDPGRDALLLGRMQSLTCDTTSRPLSDLSSQHMEYHSPPEVFSGVPLGLTSPLMVIEPLNRQLNLCGNNFASPFEYPEVKVEDSIDACVGAGPAPRDLLVNLSMSMSMSMSFGFPSRLSSKFSMDDFPVPDVPIASYPHESCLMPVLREPILTPIKPKIEDDHILTSFPHDFNLAPNVAPVPPHGSPSTPEISSIGQASETDIWDFEQYGGSPPQNLEPKEIRKSTRARRDAPKVAVSPSTIPDLHNILCFTLALIGILALYNRILLAPLQIQIPFSKVSSAHSILLKFLHVIRKSTYTLQHIKYSLY